MGAVTAAVLVAAACAAQEVKEFRSEKGRFSVELPGTPTEQTQNSRGVEAHLVLLTKAPLIYLIGYGDYAQSLIDQKGADAMLDADRDSFLKGVKGKVVTETKVTLEGNPGRDVTIQGEKAHFQLRMFLVGTRIYQVVTGGAAEAVESDPAKAFHKSFKLLK